MQSPEDSPQQGKNSYKLLLLFYTYYLITPLFKLLFLLPNFLGDLQTILVFCQDKHVDILLNIFFIPSGSTFTVSPTTTAGMLISLFNFNSNFALKIDHFYFRVVGIDSRGEDKDSTNCVICLTGNNLSLVTCDLSHSNNLSQAEMEMDNLLLFPISHICLETTQSPLVIS